MASISNQSDSAPISMRHTTSSNTMVFRTSLSAAQKKGLPEHLQKAILKRQEKAEKSEKSKK